MSNASRAHQGRNTDDVADNQCSVADREDVVEAAPHVSDRPQVSHQEGNVRYGRADDDTSYYNRRAKRDYNGVSRHAIICVYFAQCSVEWYTSEGKELSVL